MPNHSDFLSRADISSSGNVCFTLDLSVASEKRSVVNLESIGFAVKRIRPSDDNTVGNGADWRAARKVEITTSVQPGAARPQRSKSERRLFPALPWNLGKRDKVLRSAR